MKRIKLVSIMVFVLMFGTTLFVTSCEKEELNTRENYSAIDSRGGNNTKGNRGNKGNANGDNSNSKQDVCSCVEDNYPIEELSDIELNSLSHMLEEEKLARDVYITLGEKWNENVFINITKAEQKHMDAIICLYKKYDIEDNVSDNPIGIFEDDGLQTLYTALIDQGNESLVEALQVGATIEDLDIYDLIDLSDQANNEDLLAVFSELNKGSRNHMRAFNSRLEQNNSSYTTQFISQEMFESIVNSDREKGGSLCGDSNNNGNKGNKGNKGKKGNKGGRGNGN